MSVSEEDIAHALDLFSDLGDLSTRRMMGGLCIYHRGTIFALLRSDGAVLLKGVSPEFIAKLEEMGAEHWTYQRAAQKPSAMPYWTLPEAALDEPALACDLARETLSDLE